jgi:glyoxylase-like metal-dependent hydrolase (beta-lactamase superfamily II)/rhodanese-related sulfurtransferase
MKVEQIFTSCIAEMAYYIESNGEAAIIDPLREVEPYLERAKNDNAKIKYVFLTHFHADFVSGHVDLANKTGATIVYGPGATANFDFHEGSDNELFKIGDAELKLIHTPGHTMESSSYYLEDNEENKKYLFSGDALFIGDVGRPDLAIKSDLTEKDLAGHLFDSLRNRIMPLSDDTIVYPNHGAGSACGKNMSKETWDTLGNQKKTNYALRADMTKEEFIVELTTGIKPPPQYFPKNAGMNKAVNKSIDDIYSDGLTPIDVATFKEMSEDSSYLVLDTRKGTEYTQKGTIPGAIWIGIDGGFAPWVGALIVDIAQKIIIVADEGREQEVVMRLARVGYDNSQGYLKGGFDSWIAAGYEVDNIGSISAEEFKSNFESKSMEQPLDVRKESEFLSEHVVGIENFPLDSINQNFAEIDPEKEYFLHCAGGYRSLIATSIFKRNGVKNVTDVRGGFGAIKKSGIALTEYVCPTTLL